MADQVKMQAQRRTVMGKAVKQLRRQGIIPANISGQDSTPTPIQVDRGELERFMKDHQRATLIRMALPGAADQTALIGRVQRDPVSGKILHVDFMHIEMNQPIRTRIPIHLMGESTAVKNGDGMALTVINDVEVEALPADIPEVIVVDITGLADVGDTMYVRDLALPPGVRLAHANLDEPLVKIVHVRRAEAEAAAAAPAGEAASQAAEESGRTHDAMAAE